MRRLLATLALVLALCVGLAGALPRPKIGDVRCVRAREKRVPQTQRKTAPCRPPLRLTVTGFVVRPHGCAGVPLHVDDRSDRRLRGIACLLPRVGRRGWLRAPAARL